MDSRDGQKVRHLISNRFEEGAELFQQKYLGNMQNIFYVFRNIFLLIKFHLSCYFKQKDIDNVHCLLSLCQYTVQRIAVSFRSRLLLLLSLADLKHMFQQHLLTGQAWLTLSIKYNSSPHLLTVQVKKILL